MYGSLFSAHLKRYCLENLYYCTLTASVNAAMNASMKHALLIHGVSSVSPFVAIKGREEAFARSTKV